MRSDPNTKNGFVGKKYASLRVGYKLILIRFPVSSSSYTCGLIFFSKYLGGRVGGTNHSGSGPYFQFYCTSFELRFAVEVHLPAVYSRTRNYR
jgi:hypothetical protein